MILRSLDAGARNRGDGGGGGLEDDRRLHGIVGRAGVLPHVHHRVLRGSSVAIAAVVVALHRPFGRAALLRAPGAPVVTPAGV
jgi:hypothetical protein